jgi:type IV secretory pathway VirB2 component (pilin)
MLAGHKTSVKKQPRRSGVFLPAALVVATYAWLAISFSFRVAAHSLSVRTWICNIYATVRGVESLFLSLRQNGFAT